jgi:hypothetical protein
MNLTSKFRLVLIAFAAFILAAPHTTFAAPPADPCSLLTPAQVTAALGVPVAVGKDSDSRECHWLPPGANALLARKQARLHIVGSVGSLTPVDQFNIMKRPVPFNNRIVKTPVSGLGDDAVYIAGPGNMGTGTSLTVKKGSFVFQIRVYGFTLEQTKAIEKTLALNVLAKL